MRPFSVHTSYYCAPVPMSFLPEIEQYLFGSLAGFEDLLLSWFLGFLLNAPTDVSALR